jgi:hypothetical protein
MGKKHKKQKGLTTARKIHPGQEPDRGTPELAQRCQLDTVTVDKVKVAKVRDKRAIDKYYRLYCIDEDKGVAERYRRGINEQQFTAADRIANNYERAQPRLSRELTPMVWDKGINPSAYPIEVQIEALNLHNRLLKPLSPESQNIVRHICCYDECLKDYEAGKRWREGYGMIRLREALDELVDSFKALRRQNRN